MAQRRRKFWGWGYEGEGPNAEQRSAIARRFRGALRHRRRSRSSSRAAPRGDRSCARRALSPPAALAALCSQSTRRSRRAHLRQVVSRRRARLRARLLEPARRGRVPAQRSRRRRRCSTGARRRARRGDPVRRRLERRRRRRGAAATTLRRRRVDRPRAPRSRARDRPRLARRAHPGRRARPGARGSAAAARPHAAPLPAVVRVLVARRLDRDALGRPLRDALHAHRRLRRVAARR